MATEVTSTNPVVQAVVTGAAPRPARVAAARGLLPLAQDDMLEVLVALRLMGFPVSYGEALAIESVGQAVRAVGFLMPGALGVQEAGFIAVCAPYGIPAPEALALSLVKRVPDIALGLPFLFAWHAHETRALARR